MHRTPGTRIAEFLAVCLQRRLSLLHEPLYAARSVVCNVDGRTSIMDKFEQQCTLSLSLPTCVSYHMFHLVYREAIRASKEMHNWMTEKYHQ